MHKVVFLDIEGVLSIGGGIDINCCDNLLHILDSTGAKIVLSSSWRLYDDDLKYTLTHLSPYGITPEHFCGSTPNLYNKGRGTEIQEWLNHYPDITNYVVLDDNYIREQNVPSDRFFMTEYETGLTYDIAKQCVERLNNA